MTRRPPMDEAVGLLEDELGIARREIAGLNTEDAWLAFLRFGRRRFDVPDAPDADGLLVQYGTYSFDGPPMFTLDLTRQFEIAGADGGHDHYVQVHCELRYRPAPALRALGSFGSWFFHDAGDDLDQWARVLSERADWATIRTFEPSEIRVYREQV